VKADGFEAEQIRNHGGKEVLPAVLLHVIEPAMPVYLAFDLGIPHGRREKVNYPLAIVDYIFNGNSIDGSNIVRLTARGGIESGLIQHHTPGVLAAVRYACAEGHLIRVCVIESLRDTTQWRY
jgi:hypothetical protein